MQLHLARMGRTSTRAKISARTRESLADPETKLRHVAGLQAAWADPTKRAAQAILTRQRMAAWRAKRLDAAETVLRQLPQGDREVALAALASAAEGGSKA